MLKRTITGAVYACIIVAFFLLREFVDYRLFHLLTYAFCVIGTYELAEMTKPFSLKNGYQLSIVYGIVFVIAYCLTQYIFWVGYGWLVALILCVLAIMGILIYARISKSKLKPTLITLLSFVYPSLFLLTTLLINDLNNGFVALLLLFVISPCADVMAYLIGMAYNKIRKGQAKKLCPKLSPKKTVAGAIGGLIGGAIGGIIVFLACRPPVNFFSPILLFVIIGFVASLLTEIGDLFESAIKRRAGVKDSGKILPGHGGVLDRIDGMMFASVFIYLTFLLV